MPCSAVMATEPFMAMMGKCANSPNGKCLAEAPEARITTGPCWVLRHASKLENAPRSAQGCDGSVFINGIFELVSTNHNTDPCICRGRFYLTLLI